MNTSQQQAICQLQGQMNAKDVAEAFGISLKHVYRAWHESKIKVLKTMALPPKRTAPGATHFRDGLAYKVEGERMWRWSDIERDWIKSNRPIEEVLKYKI